MAHVREDIMKFDIKRRPSRPVDNAYALILESVRRDFVPSRKLVPLTLGAVTRETEFPRNKSPGLPWIITHPGLKKGDILDHFMPDLRRTWDLVGRGAQVSLPDTAAYFRAQLCSHDANKIRGVWGFPVSVTIEEARYVYPYLKWLKSNDCSAPTSYGLEMANGGMAYINDMVKVRNPGVVMTDWSSFDKTPPCWLIRDAFAIVQDAFRLDMVESYSDEHWPVRPDRTLRRWSKMVRYFINTPVRLQNGERYRKTGGVPSGSAWTNIIDTIINVIVTRYLSYHCTGYLPLGEIYHGDDAVVVPMGIMNLEDWAKLGSSAFGMNLSTKKSWVTSNPKNVQFLGYYNNCGYPIRSNDFMIASFIEPERRIESPIETTARAVGQMYSTLHPGQALKWYNIIVDLVKASRTWFDDPRTEITKFISDHPERFKYLAHVGVDLKDVRLPELDGSGMLECVSPVDRPRREFKLKHRKITDYLRFTVSM